MSKRGVNRNKLRKVYNGLDEKRILNEALYATFRHDHPEEAKKYLNRANKHKQQMEHVSKKLA